MAGQEETEEAQTPFNFWELIAMMDEDHKKEVLDLKETIEEKDVEISRLNKELEKELEKKEKAKIEGDERAQFWYRMNEVTMKLMRMKGNQENYSFLEKGQRNPGRKKHTIMQSQTNSMMNTRKNVMMNPIQKQRNPIMNLQIQNMVQMTVKPTMTMPTSLPSQVRRQK